MPIPSWLLRDDKDDFQVWQEKVDQDRVLKRREEMPGPPMGPDMVPEQHPSPYEFHKGEGPEPPIYPGENPTRDLMRRTALEKRFRPEARADLEQIPTSVYLTEETPWEGSQGRYWESRINDTDPNMEIWERPGSNSGVPTMAHEYAHKVYRKNLPPSAQNYWNENYEELVGGEPTARQMALRYAPDAPGSVSPVEIHATAAEAIGENLPIDTQEDFYSNTWQEKYPNRDFSRYFDRPERCYTRSRQSDSFPLGKSV